MKHQPVEKSCCSKSAAKSNIVSRNCNCFHADKHSDDYIIEGRYKVVLPVFENCDFTSFTYTNPFTIDINKQQKEIKTNSPPIYITNSTFII